MSDNRVMGYRTIPPQPDRRRQRLKVLAEIKELQAQMLERRGGKPIDIRVIDRTLREVRGGDWDESPMGDDQITAYRTVEPIPDAPAKMLAVLERVRVIRAEILAARGGKPFDACNIDEALREVRGGD